MRKWMPLLPLLMVAALTAIAWPSLPAMVQPALYYLVPVAKGAEPIPRIAFVLFLPGIMLAVWALFALLARVRRVPTLPESLAASAVQRFEPTYHVVVLGVVSMLALMHVALLSSAAGWPAWTLKAVGVVLGAGLFLVGNLMPRVRPNWIVGIRTPATLSDPQLWLRAHRYFGGLLMASSIVVIVVAIVATRYAFVAMVVGLLVSAVLAHLWASATKPSAAAVIAGALLTLVASSAHGQQPAPAEEAFDIPAKQITLPGTLTLPGKAKPDVVVMVAGSGPTDRNGNGPLVQTDTYKQIAHALARGGYASLRYDKRGLGPSGRTIDHTALSVDDYVADVTAAVDTLIASGRFGRVFLLGHSEGTMHVTLASNRGARVAGVILLSPTGRKFAEVLHDQFALVAGSATLARADTAFAQFIRGENPVDAPDIAKPVLVPFYRKMIASMAAYDPAKEVAALTRPPLVITGAMDYQTPRKDFDALRAARPDARFVLIENANHVFKRVESASPAAQQNTYHDASLPIVDELMPAMLGWLSANNQTH